MDDKQVKAGTAESGNGESTLRQLMQAQRAAELRQVTPAQTGQFLARLRQQKLRHSAFQWTRWALAASVLLALGGLLKPFLLPDAEHEAASIMRGDNETQTLRAADHAAKADRIQRLLESRGIPVRRIAEAGAIQLQARVPVGDDTLRQALQQEGVILPPHGRLDVLLQALR